MQNKNGYLNSLDWLRAVAIVLVLFSHWSSVFLWKEHPYYRWLASINDFIVDFIQVPATIHPGVIIFIVLSGFVIYYPNAKKKHKDPYYKIQISSFIKRRFIRIYPSLLVVLCLGLLVVYFRGEFSIEEIIQNGMLSAFMLYAFYDTGEPYLNPHLVTVIVELVLYLQYLIVYRVYNLQMTGLVIVAFLFIPVSLMYEYNTHWAWHNLVSFTPYWVMGVIAAELFVFKNKLIKKYIDFSLLLVLFFSYIVAVILCYLSEKDADFFSRYYSLTISKLLFFLAAISYSLYLIHWLLINLILDVFNSKNIGLTPSMHLFILLAIITVSFVFYVLLERPSHKLARRF